MLSGIVLSVSDATVGWHHLYLHNMVLTKPSNSIVLKGGTFATLLLDTNNMHTFSLTTL